jgi:hypothetical protein
MFNYFAFPAFTKGFRRCKKCPYLTPMTPREIITTTFLAVIIGVLAIHVWQLSTDLNTCEGSVRAATEAAAASRGEAERLRVSMQWEQQAREVLAAEYDSLSRALVNVGKLRPLQRAPKDAAELREQIIRALNTKE